MRTVSLGFPKPMLKLSNRYFLDIIINAMVGAGFKRFILGLGYKADIIEKYYSKKKIPGVEIIFSREKKLLDTGGAIKNARRFIHSNPFMVLNGDSFCYYDPYRFLKFHQKKKALVSALLKRVKDGSDFGAVMIDRAERIVNFREKTVSKHMILINAGVYIFDQKIFKMMPLSLRFSLERDFFPSLIGQDIYGYKTQGFFIDIGTPERYRKAINYFKRMGMN